MRALWPAGEAAQADYEQLRQAVLNARPLAGATAARFETQGLWGLIRRPVSELVFVARLLGAARPAWTPYGDPRLDVLADAYELIVTVSDEVMEGTGT